MMSKKSHWFYLFVVLLCAGVFYFDYYRGEQSKEQKNKEAILIPILKEEVSQIELKNSSGELEIIKKEDQWMLKKPVEDLAAHDDVNGWIQSLTTEKSTEKIEPGDSFEWSTYGLDKPKSHVVVTSKTGQKIQLQISERKNFEGNSFIKKDEENVVYVGDSLWNALLEKSVQDLRDKRLLRESLGELEEVVITQGQELARFVIKEGQWMLKDRPHWKLDQNKTREIVNLIQEMKTQAFVLESEPTKAQRALYGFHPQSLKMTYSLKGARSFVFEFAQDKTKKWYAWPYDLHRLVQIEEAPIQKITHLNVETLRDKELPFIFNKEDVKKLHIISDKKVELSKEGDTWKATEPGTVETTEVNEFLEKLRQLRVAEFMDGKTTAPGLDAEKKRFTLTDAAGQNLLDLKIGTSFKKKENKEEKSYVYAKSSIYPDVIVLKEEDLAGLVAASLMKPKTEADAKSESPESDLHHASPSLKNEKPSSSEMDTP